MSRRYWLLLPVALGLGLVVCLITVMTVLADPVPGKKVQIPRIDVGNVYGTGDWETWIQVQNMSMATDTGAVMFVWGEYSELCPTNAPGPIAHECQSIAPNGVWTVKHQLTTAAKSAIIYSVDEGHFDLACELSDHTTEPRYSADPSINWRKWKEDWEDHTTILSGTEWITKSYFSKGEDLAVVVNREGPNEYTTTVSSAYPGITEWMEGVGPPTDYTAHVYYVPYLMKGYHDLNTELTIQNSGQGCTSLEIDYMEQGTCAIVLHQHITLLAPGEAIRLKLPCGPGEISCGWLGSARISSYEPLGIIVDQTTFKEPCPVFKERGTLLTSRGRPWIEERQKPDGTTFFITDTVFYADLTFREWSGWETGIQVQNLSPNGRSTFVTVELMDASGDQIVFLGDWVCPIGSRTFYLPAFSDLDFTYVGAAEIRSHRQVGFPSEQEMEAEPIFVTVDLKKTKIYSPTLPGWIPAEPGEAQGGSYNAHPESEKTWTVTRTITMTGVSRPTVPVDIALPFLARTGQGKWTSLIALRNNDNCTKIKPQIWLKNQNGTVIAKLDSFWLQPKHVKLINLDDLGYNVVPYNWDGAGEVIIQDYRTDVEALCCPEWSDTGVCTNTIKLSAVVVEQGVGTGDTTKIYEGIIKHMP